MSTTVSGLVVTPSASDDLAISRPGLSKGSLTIRLAGWHGNVAFTIPTITAARLMPRYVVHPRLGRRADQYDVSHRKIVPAPCGGGVVLSANRLHGSFSGGSVAAGTNCIRRPRAGSCVACANGVYRNRTTSLNATIGGTPVVLPAVTSDVLTVNDNLLLLEKQFTDTR